MNKPFRYILFLLVLLSLDSCVNKPQDQHYAQADTTISGLKNPVIQDYTKVETKVKLILSDCKATNELKLVKTTVKFEQDESKCIDGREINFYSYEGQLLKITDKGYFADDDWNFELYYKNNQVCFIYEERVGGPVSNPSTYQITYYFDQRELIRSVENNKSSESGRTGNIELGFADRLFNSFTDKDYPPVLCNKNY